MIGDETPISPVVADQTNMDRKMSAIDIHHEDDVGDGVTR